MEGGGGIRRGPRKDRGTPPAPGPGLCPSQANGKCPQGNDLPRAPQAPLALSSARPQPSFQMTVMHQSRLQETGLWHPFPCTRWAPKSLCSQQPPPAKQGATL